MEQPQKRKKLIIWLFVIVTVVILVCLFRNTFKMLLVECFKNGGAMFFAFGVIFCLIISQWKSPILPFNNNNNVLDVNV